MKYKPHGYQEFGQQHLLNHDAAALFLDMGLGKTVVTLTVLDLLLYDRFEAGRTLVIAPKRVAEFTWTDEAAKWDHLHHLRFSKVLGTEKQRKAALRQKADIWLINRENLPWLVGYYGTSWPFDTVVIDELSSFKNHDSLRFKQLKKVRPLMRRVYGLTGTPRPNGLMDLWAPLYLLDQGKRLGSTIGEYRRNFFKEGKRNANVVFTYDLKDAGCEKAIYDRISDICVSMRAQDYLQLPERVDRIVPIHLPPATLAKYDEFEKVQVMTMETGEDITAFNVQALTQKLLQFGNGAVYNGDKSAWHEVHMEKLDMLEEIIDTAAGKPVMVFYWYKHDLERLQTRFKALKPRTLDTEKDIRDWNAGKIPLLFLHPASAGHGLNLQAGGNIIVWFSLTWSLELYQQAVARLYRQGQTQAVINHHLVAMGTMDEYVMEVLRRKEKGQDTLMEAVKAIIHKHKADNV